MKVWISLFALSLTACVMPKRNDHHPAQAPASNGETSPSTPEVVIPKLTDLGAVLSSNQVIDGTIIGVTAKVPEHRQDEKPKIIFEDTTLPMFPGIEPGLWHGWVGIPFGTKAGSSSLQVKWGSDQDARTWVLTFNIVAGDYPSERLKVPPSKVNPKKKDMARIKKEQIEISAIYKTITETKYWDGPFLLPIQSAITSPYGSKRVYNGQMQSFHQGTDLRAAVGTPIHAPAGGIVKMAKDLFFTGYTVIIDHGYGLASVYGHMSKLKVKSGEIVKKGQLLGLSGKTGRVSGPHLHWGMVLHKVKVDPMSLTQNFY